MPSLELKPPFRIKSPKQGIKKVFLAGSIEMGKTEPWQDRLADAFKDEQVIFFNPRRDDWDSSWAQDPKPGTKFHEQVTWELDHIHEADIVVFYFDPKTKSPVTLMELGHISLTGDQIFKGLSSGMTNTKAARDYLISKGYDGLRYNGGLNMDMRQKHDVYCPYNASSIKIEKVQRVVPKPK